MTRSGGARGYVALDLGATSARCIRGELLDGVMHMQPVHRWPTRAVRLPDGIHWDVFDLFSGILESIRLTGELGTVESIGIDAWGLDYALLDDRNRMLGLPFHYRDTRTRGMFDRVHAIISRAELYRATGTQMMPINTVYQLMADADAGLLQHAAGLALMPDLMALWLTGESSQESTVASTSGLIDVHSRSWARALIRRLALPDALFHALTEPGTRIGDVLHEHADANLGGRKVPVVAVAGHDTASAFLAAARPRSAVISSGTWSLVGIEARKPIVSSIAAELNVTNELGADGTIRVLRNVMGLWLLQQCAKSWSTSEDDLVARAAREQGDVPLFDPDDPDLLAPGMDMPDRLGLVVARSSQSRPLTAGQLIRSLLVSLACAYRHVLESVEAAANVKVESVVVVGGGTRHSLLSQLSADVIGRPVQVRAPDGTALGNLLMQARYAGELTSRDDLRSVADASMPRTDFFPSADRTHWEQVYQQFLAVTNRPVVGTSLKGSNLHE